jgi:hypothetical protein
LLSEEDRLHFVSEDVHYVSKDEVEVEHLVSNSIYSESTGLEVISCENWTTYSTTYSILKSHRYVSCKQVVQFSQLIS